MKGVLPWLHCNGVYIFLFWELWGLSPNFHIHVSMRDFYIPRISLHISSTRTSRPSVGIYNSLTLTDTWMWKLGLRPRYLFFGNIWLKCLAFCLCSVVRWARHAVTRDLFELYPSLAALISPVQILFSSLCNLGRQSCRAACLRMSVSGMHTDRIKAKKLRPSCSFN